MGRDSSDRPSYAPSRSVASSEGQRRARSPGTRGTRGPEDVGARGLMQADCEESGQVAFDGEL